MTYYVRPYAHRQMRRMANRNDIATLRVNLREENDSYELTAAVPGLSAEDLNIQVLENVVRIDGEYRSAEDEYLLRELPEGKFTRTLRLPNAIDADKVDAKIHNGILFLSLPKVASARPKEIKIVSK